VLVMFCGVCIIAVGPAAAHCSMSGSVPVSHLANVEALVQRAAAEAATRCGAGQMEHSFVRQSSLPLAPPPCYAASTDVVCFKLCFVVCFVQITMSLAFTVHSLVLSILTVTQCPSIGGQLIVQDRTVRL